MEEENKKEETKKKSGKKIVIIVAIILIVLILAGVCGYFAYEYIEANKTVGTQWGDKYYEFLKEAKQEDNETKENLYGISENAQNATIEFTEVIENEEPEMIMRYTENEQKYATIYYFDNNDEVNFLKYTAPVNIELLYNIPQQKYKWYVQSSNESGRTYESLEDVINNSKNANNQEELDLTNVVNQQETNDTEMYTFKLEEIESTDEKVSKFDDTFIIPEDVEDKKVDFNMDLDEKEFKKMVEKTVEEYKPKEQIITEETKTKTKEKETALEAKKEEIKRIEEEKARQEELKRQEEERKKAEELAKGLKVGNCTLKYGKYVSNITQMDSKLSGTITLEPDGKFYIKSNYKESSGMGTGLDCSGTYTVKLNQPTGYPDDYANYIIFKPSKGEEFSFEVHKNNSFSDQYHGYNYAG